MKVADMLAGTEFDADGGLASDVTSLATYPEAVRPPCVFVKVRRGNHHERGTAAAAVGKGAAAVVVSHGDDEIAALDAKGVPVIRVENPNRAAAAMSANFFGNAHRSLTLIAITGTKGKTTTAHLLDSILRAHGLRTALLSSVTWRTPASEVHSPLTTPEPFELHMLLRRAVDEGATHAIIEASSIGIAEERVSGLKFAATLFTNLGGDHVTYHGGREAYIAAKHRLFEDDECVAVVNCEDETGRSFAATARGTVVTYGLDHGDVHPERWSASLEGVALRLGRAELRSALPAAHNVANVVAACALARTLGIGNAAIAEGIASLRSIPGRMERVDSENGVSVYVDYAHTPESVAAVLDAFRGEAGRRRRVVVFGCGGQTDRAKRPLMTAAALLRTDLCILTNDNPRLENPQQILSDMLAGVAVSDLVNPRRIRVTEERRQAIRDAIRLASPDGIVILLGKGDERFQIIGTQPKPFSDREVAAEALALRGGACAHAHV